MKSSFKCRSNPQDISFGEPGRTRRVIGSLLIFVEDMTTMFRGQEEASTASIFCTSYMHDDTSACLVCALVLMWIVGPGMIPRRLFVIRCFFKPTVASIKAVSAGCIQLE